MFKKIVNGVKKGCKWVMDKSLEVAEKSVKYVETKVDNFKNASKEELNNMGNMLAIMGPIAGVAIGGAVGLIGVGIKIYARTK